MVQKSGLEKDCLSIVTVNWRHLSSFSVLTLDSHQIFQIYQFCFNPHFHKVSPDLNFSGKAVKIHVNYLINFH